MSAGRMPWTARTFLAEDFLRDGGSVASADRPLLAGEDLHDTMALRESRKITGDLMVHYKHKLYRILPSPETLKMVRKTCEVVEWIDGSVELRCDGVTLPYALFDKGWAEPRTEIVENKRLGAAMSWVKAKQKDRLAQGRVPARARKREKERIAAKVAAG